MKGLQCKLKANQDLEKSRDQYTVGAKIPFNLPHIFSIGSTNHHLTDVFFPSFPTRPFLGARSSAAVRPHREEIPFDELE